MPIYECHCIKCDVTFEVLAHIGGARRKHACPECGRPSARIASAFAIVSGGANLREAKAVAAAGAKPPGARKKNGPPVCLQYPHIPMLCHMDEKSAKRWVAHFNGRGAEYDDKTAARAELRKQRGLPPPPEPAPTGHAHGHAHNPRRHGSGNGAAHAHDHAHGSPADAHSHNGAGPHTNQAANGGANATVRGHGHAHGDARARDH